MIEFIEKERYYDDSAFTGQCWMYPTFMVKDGIEDFMWNRREPDDSWKIKEREGQKAELLATMVTPPQKKGGDRPMRRPTPKLQWEGTGLTRHCLSYPRSFWQTVSRPSHCGVRFAQVEKRTTTHTRVTKQAEWQWAAAGAG